jgi:hypothetical protein
MQTHEAAGGMGIDDRLPPHVDWVPRIGAAQENQGTQSVRGLTRLTGARYFLYIWFSSTLSGGPAMAIARAHLVNPALARWYHCVTRCVRRAFLLGEGQDNRKVWIEQRLQELAQIFAVAVGGFAVMDNHIHMLLRIDPDAANRLGVRRLVNLGRCPAR